MSKKILKRSLALGALMAFVITGSAMAADVVGNRILADVNDVNDDAINITSDICGQTGYAYGSAVYNAGGEVYISGVGEKNLVKFNDNTSTSYAGAIYTTGKMEIKYAQFQNNKELSTNDNGGGAITNHGNLKIEDSIFESNNGGRGGAINNNGTLKIYNSKFNNNSTNKTGSTGTAIHSSNDLYMEGCSFEGNYCTVQGNDLRSVYVSGGKATLKDNKFIKNFGGGINVYGTNTVVYMLGENIFEKNTGTALGVAQTSTKVYIGIKEDGSLDESSRTIFDGNDSAISLKGTSTEVTFGEGSYAEFKNNGNEEDVGGAVRVNGTSVINFNGKAVFSNNVGKNGLNDIENNNIVNIGSAGIVSINSGMVGTGTTNLDGTLEIGADSTIAKLGGENGTIRFIADADLTVTANESKGLTFAANGVANDAVAGNVNELLKNVDLNDDINTLMELEEGDVQGRTVVNLVVDEATGKLEEAIIVDQAVNSKSDAVSDAGMTLKGHWRAHMNDMNKRMGELRNANGEHGVWTRMVRGESEYQGAKMQYNQYQLGYDEKLSVDKRWTVGAAVTFSEGDASYGSGSTDDKSTAFAIYGSKLNNDGTFVDLIARYAKLESDLEDRTYGTGDYSTNGYSVSAEFGKRIQQGNGLWIEPQVELTYGSVDCADVALSNKVTGKKYNAHYDSMDSFIARAGFALGKDIKQGNVYARASYLYDFDGETETQFAGGNAIKEDFGGGWWEVGVGANINLSKATYIYADVEKTFGGEVDTNWQWNLGVRYSF